MKSFVMRRLAWLFSQTENDANASVTLYSIVESKTRIDLCFMIIDAPDKIISLDIIRALFNLPTRTFNIMRADISDIILWRIDGSVV